jgi:hypothetical protein
MSAGNPASTKRGKAAPEPQTVNMPPPGSGEGRIKAIGGSQNDTFNNVLANQVIKCLWLTHSDPAERDKLYTAALTALIAIAPKDETEGMMAAQMVATHAAAMECFRRAMISEQSLEGRRENLNFANKLVRSHAVLVEALNKHRGKGAQKVTVEHVHVHSGGQAIVGTVERSGGGVAAKSEEQPHAPARPAVTYEPGTTLRSADPQGAAVPVARGTGAEAL